ncbi:unnamed protein product [Musa acuminata subsp. burmannicoides]
MAGNQGFKGKWKAEGADEGKVKYRRVGIGTAVVFFIFIFSNPFATTVGCGVRRPIDGHRRGVEPPESVELCYVGGARTSNRGSRSAAHTGERVPPLQVIVSYPRDSYFV